MGDQRAAHVIAYFRFDGDYIRAAAEVLLCQSRPGDQATSTDGTKYGVHVELFAKCVRVYLAHERGLSGDYPRIVERMQQCEALLPRDLTRPLTRDFFAVA